MTLNKKFATNYLCWNDDLSCFLWVLTVSLLLSSALVHCFLILLILQSVIFQILHNQFYIIKKKKLLNLEDLKRKRRRYPPLR